MFAIAPTASDDLKAVQATLKEILLPIDDLTAQHLRHFLVVRHGAPVVACVGMEQYGETALLRSLAVYDFMRGDGWGKGWSPRWNTRHAAKACRRFTC